jgi:transaldolase
LQLFLDTASLDEIKQGARLGVIKGVTTNPSLAAEVGIGGFKAYKSAVQQIASIIDGPISVEVVSTDVEGMITEGKDMATWIPNPWVKLPSTDTGFQAMAVLAREGIKINQTLCFSTNQALLGAQAGATVVSPFVGRLDDIGQRGMDLVAEIAQIFARYRDRGVTTKVMAASVRSPFHCIEAAKAGADIATIPFPVLTQMTKHPLTDIGVARFLEDWRKASKA